MSEPKDPAADARAAVPVGVLISGSGTNLQALIDATRASDHPARIAMVISNRRDAGGLERARSAGIPAVWVPHRRRSRHEHETELIGHLREAGVQWLCLAGYMRLVTGTLLDAFPQRVLNIHPALLPAFPGTHGQAQALAYGTTVAGATVHLVDDGTDTGPVIAQGVVPVRQDDDEASLGARILQLEHQLYPMALRWAVEGRLSVEGRRVSVALRPGERRALFFGEGGFISESA